LTAIDKKIKECVCADSKLEIMKNELVENKAKNRFFVEKKVGKKKFSLFK